MEYIYGAEVTYSKKLNVEKYPIAKETEKSVLTEHSCPCLGYRKRHSKRLDPIFRTPEEAVNALAKSIKGKLEKLQGRIKYWEEKLNIIKHLKERVLAPSQQEATLSGKPNE